MAKIIYQYFFKRFLLQLLVIYFSLALVFTGINFLEKLDAIVRFQGSLFHGFILSVLEFWLFTDLMLILAASAATGIFMFSIFSSNELKAYRSLGYTTQNLSSTVMLAIMLLVSLGLPIIDLTQIMAQKRYDDVNRRVRGEINERKDLTIVENNWLVFIKRYRPKPDTVSQIYAFKIVDGKPTFVIHSADGNIDPRSRMPVVKIAKTASIKFDPKFTARVMRFKGNTSRVVPVKLSDVNVYGINQRIPVYQLIQTSSSDAALPSVRNKAAFTLWSKITMIVFGPMFSSQVAFLICSLKSWSTIFPFILSGAVGVVSFLALNMFTVSSIKSLDLNPVTLPLTFVVIMSMLVICKRNM